MAQAQQQPELVESDDKKQRMYVLVMPEAALRELMNLTDRTKLHQLAYFSATYEPADKLFEVGKSRMTRHAPRADEARAMEMIRANIKEEYQP